MDTQIAFGRMHPQWNQMCRSFSGDLMHGYYAEHNLQNIKEQFIERISDLIDNAYQPVVTSRNELRNQLLAMSTVKKVVFRKDGMSVYLHDITCKPSGGNDEHVQNEFICNNKKPDVNVIIPGLILGLRWTISTTNTFFSYSLNVAKNVGQKHRGYCGRSLAHPHWISRNAPCLGDFEQSISDAQHNLNIPLQITILIMYLEQYNYRDCAGAYMHNWAPERDLLPDPFTVREKNNYIDLVLCPRIVLPYEATLEAYKWLATKTSGLADDERLTPDRIYRTFGEHALSVSREHATGYGALDIINLAYLNTWSGDEALRNFYLVQLQKAAAHVGSFIKSINIKHDYRLYFATTWGQIDDADREYFLEAHNVTIFDHYYCPHNDGALLILQDKNNNIKQPPKEFAQYIEMDSYSLEAFYKLSTPGAPYAANQFVFTTIEKILNARSQGFCNRDALQILVTAVNFDYPHKDSNDE